MTYNAPYGAIRSRRAAKKAPYLLVFFLPLGLIIPACFLDGAFNRLGTPGGGSGPWFFDAAFFGIAPALILWYCITVYCGGGFWLGAGYVIRFFLRHIIRFEFAADFIDDLIQKNRQRFRIANEALKEIESRKACARSGDECPYDDPEFVATTDAYVYRGNAPYRYYGEEPEQVYEQYRDDLKAVADKEEAEELGRLRARYRFDRMLAESNQRTIQAD
jgi:hypothetical protein